jgi:phage terminase Nu1 subunit (DNA packaging protein)
VAESDVPDYNEERARHEREKRMLAELDRRVKEGELVYRADFVTAQNAVAAQIMNRADALPRQIKQAIPHLLIEEVEKIERLIKEMMEGVANWSYEELEEDQ